MYLIIHKNSVVITFNLYLFLGNLSIVPFFFSPPFNSKVNILQKQRLSALRSAICHLCPGTKQLLRTWSKSSGGLLECMTHKERAQGLGLLKL